MKIARDIATGVLIALIALLAMSLATGCSPAIGDWATRGEEGLTIEAANVAAWHQAQAAALSRDRQALIDGVWRDLGSRATTQPVTSQWLADQKTVFVASLAALDLRRLQLEQAYQTNLGNVQSIREAVARIKALNAIYAGDRQALAADVSRLSAAVEAMLRSQKGASP